MINWFHIVILSVVTAISSIFGINQSSVTPVASSTPVSDYQALQSDSTTSVKSSVPVEQSHANTADWKVYTDSLWGFTVSYPPQYYLQNFEKTNQGLPMAGSLIEIRDAVATSSDSKIFDISVGLVLNVKSYADIYAQFTPALVNSYKAKSISVATSSIVVNNQNVPLLTLKSVQGRSEATAYVIKPPLVFKMEYAPADDTTFKNILSSISFSPTSNASTTAIHDIYTEMAVTASKDSFWCGQLTRVEDQNQCEIGLRGSAKFDFTPVDLSTAQRGTGGSGGTVTGSTISLTGGKGSNAWLAVGITTKTDTDAIDFDVDMTNADAAQSLLTVYLNTTKIGMVDGRVSPGKSHQRFSMYNPNEGTSTIIMHPYSPDFVPPGVYSLSFRLDQFAAGGTSATISNVQVGLAH
jgi:hypothetical protein